MKNIYLISALLLITPRFGTSISFAQSGWFMQGHDAQRTGRGSTYGPISAALKWTFNFRTQLQDNASPVVGPDGTIYCPAKEDFYAINPDGSLKWKKEDELGNRWGMVNAPALSPDGNVVYVLSGSYNIYLTALSTDKGDVLWQFPMGNISNKVSYSSFAVGESGTIYIGTWKPAVYAINPNGTLKWRYDSSSRCAIEAPPAVDSNGNVYFEHNCVGLVALDSTGVLKWTDRRVIGDYGWPTPTIGLDGTLYIHISNYTFKSLFAINPDGTPKWSRGDIGEAGFFKGIAISADGSTIFTAADGKVYALDSATGATQWVNTIAGSDEEFGGTPALSKNGILYLKGSSDQVYAVSSLDGSLIWQYQLNTSALYWGPQSPAIGPDGTLYVVSSGELGPIGSATPGRLHAFFTPVTIPMPPTLASPTNGAINQPLAISLRWNPSVGTETFHLQVSTDSLFRTTVVDESIITRNSRQVGSLTNLKTYYWRVNAKNASGTSAWSNVWSFTTVIAAPSMPTLASPTNGGINQPVDLTLSWHPSIGAATYRLQFATTSDFLDPTVDDSTLTTTSRHVGPLTNNTTYYWHVKAKNVGGTSTWSSPVWSFTTVVQLPSQVQLISPGNFTVIRVDSMRFTWRQSGPIVSRYGFELSTDSLMTEPFIDSTITDVTTIRRKLLKSQVYWWRVKAKNTAGWGPYSAQRRFQIDIPTGVQKADEAPHEFRLSQNYPNPFNPSTTISFSLPRASMVTLKIFNIKSEEAATLISGQLPAGRHQTQWNAIGFANGVYFYRLQAGEKFLQTRKLVLLK